MKLKRPSPAMAVALVALFVALGGSALAGIQLARNSVGSTQIRAGAVGSSELRSNSVTGSKVLDGSLSASDIRGAVSAAALAQCPSGTSPLAGTCFENALRGPATLANAIKACGAAARRVPTVSELLAAAAGGLTLGNPELAGDANSDSNVQWIVYADASTVALEPNKNERPFRCVGLPVG